MTTLRSLHCRVLASLHLAIARVRREHGQGLVEYSLILTLITVGLILIVTVIGKQNGNLWSNIQNGLTTAGNGS